MNDNKFQWRRVGMIFRLYYPMIKWQLICYPLLSLAMAGLLALGGALGLDMLGALGSLLVSVAYYLGPIAITHRDYRQVSNILPVTAAEKFAFLVLYFCIATYLMLNLPCIALQYLFPDYVPCYLMSSPTMPAIKIGALGYLCGFMSSISTMTVCLWAMTVAKTSRAAIIVAAWVGCNFVAGLVGGIGGAVYALNHIEIFQNLDSPEGIHGLSEMLKLVFVAAIPLSVLIISIFATLLYKKLKTRGF